MEDPKFKPYFLCLNNLIKNETSKFHFIKSFIKLSNRQIFKYQIFCQNCLNIKLSIMTQSIS